MWIRRKNMKNKKESKKRSNKEEVSDISMIVDEVRRKSEERRKKDFSTKRTPEFLMSIEKAVAMGQRDEVTSAIRNMFVGTDISLDALLGDILPKLQESVKELLGEDSVWSYVKYNNSFPKKNAVKIMGSQIRRGDDILGGGTNAIMSAIESQAASAAKDAEEAYSRAVDAVIEDLRIRLLRKIGCIKVVVDRDVQEAVPIEM
jgi:hypothetical protein